MIWVTARREPVRCAVRCGWRGSILRVIPAVSHTVTRRTRVPIAQLFDTVVAEDPLGRLGAEQQILLAERPASYSYRVTGLDGPLRLLAGEAVGWWSFEPDGTGSRAAWTFTFQPRSALLRGALRGYVRMRWARAMNRGIDRCVAIALSRRP